MLKLVHITAKIRAYPLLFVMYVLEEYRLGLRDKNFCREKISVVDSGSGRITIISLSLFLIIFCIFLPVFRIRIHLHLDKSGSGSRLC
jgi:hypothetical protein